MAKIQKYSASITKSQNLLQSSTEPSDLARLKAVSFQHAGDWLNCLPIKSCGLGLSDEAIRVAVGLCLGANLCQPHTCACGVLVHQRSRHASINDLIYHSLNKAGFPAIKEPQGILRSDGRRPDGTTLIPRRAGRNLVWDAAVIETLATSYLQATAATAGAAAEIADARKTKKYQDLLNTHHFIPLSMETLGPINETGITFVADIGRLLTQATDEGRETSFIFQRLSVTIQRFNAVAGTFTAPLPEFEQRLFDRRLHHSRYRPSFVDRGNQSESPRCHDSLSPIANLTNSACASRPPNPPAVQVLLDATRDSVHHREIGHTCGSLRESVADVRLSESGEEEDSHLPEDIERRLRGNLHVLHPTGPDPTDEPRRLRHGLRPDCPKRPDRAARADQS